MLVQAESTSSSMTGLRQVIEREGLPRSLYSDGASHFFRTPKAGEPVDRQALSQVGRALRELSIKLVRHIHHKPEDEVSDLFVPGRGACLAGLRIKGISSAEEANRFLRRSYIREFNRKFTSPATDAETSAFVPCVRGNLDRIFSIQTERTVNRDNTVKYRNLILLIDKEDWRRSKAGCRVVVYQHLNDPITIGYGPQLDREVFG